MHQLLCYLKTMQHCQVMSFRQLMINKFKKYLYGISAFLRLKNPPAGYGILQKTKHFLWRNFLKQ